MNRLIAFAAPARAVVLALLVAAGFAAMPGAQAQNARPPERLTYQGFLVDGNGVALGNTAPKNYDVIFRIYTADTAGTLLWSEQQTVTVDKGYFSVLLGEGAEIGEPRPALPTIFKGPTASDRFVGISVKGIGAGGATVNILPRLRLLPSPYAFLAEQATKLVRTDNNNDLLTSSGNAVTLTGTMTVSSTLTANSFSGSGTSLTGVAKLAGGNTFTGNQIIPRIGLEGSTNPGFPLNFANVLGDKISLWGQSGNSYGFGVQSSLFQIHTDGVGGDIAFGYGSSASMTENVRFKGNGNVGIGINPTIKLEVAGAAGITGANTLEFGRGVAGKQTDAGKIGYGTFVADALNIVGAGTTGFNRKVQVYAEGGMNVTGALTASSLVGNGASVTSIDADHITTGTLGLSRIPSGVVKESTGSGLTFQVSGNAQYTYHSSDKSRYAAIFRADGGLFLRIYGVNNHGSDTRSAVYDGDSNWDFSSDRRLKKDIVDVEPLLERALKVPVRRYRWKDEGSESKHKLGVIAQEVQPLFPEIVGEIDDPDSGGKTLTVGYSDFGVIAIKAIQELKARHDAEVTGLKGEIADLKAQMAEVLKATAEIRAQAEKAKSTAAVGR